MLTTRSIPFLIPSALALAPAAWAQDAEQPAAEVPAAEVPAAEVLAAEVLAAEVPADQGPGPMRPYAMRPIPKRAASPRTGRLGTPTMRPWGQLQLWSTLWDQDLDPQADPASYGDPEADPGFNVQRARLGFEGVLRPESPNDPLRVSYFVTVGVGSAYDVIGGANPEVAIVDAIIQAAAPNAVGMASATIGLVKVPFSREALMASTDLVFEERAVNVEWLLPLRDAGFIASHSILLGNADPDAVGDDTPLQIVARAGVFNGNATNLAGARPWLGDTDAGLRVAGRVELVKGETYRTFSYEGASALGIAASATQNTRLATSERAWNFDFLGRLGPVTLNGEVGRATFSPTDSTIARPDVVNDTTRTGASAQVSVFAPFKNRRSGVEVAGRVATFDDNILLNDNGDVMIIHGGLSWRDVVPGFDLGGGYIHRIERGGIKLPNDTIRLWTQIRPQDGRSR